MVHPHKAVVHAVHATTVYPANVLRVFISVVDVSYACNVRNFVSGEPARAEHHH